MGDLPTEHQEQDERTAIERYLSAVEVEREYTRAEFGDDSGKSPGFLLTVLAASLGEVADAIIGNTYGEDRIANAEAAMEQMVVVGGACVSLYELLDRLLLEFKSASGDKTL
jgi:hypothetical protein